MAMQFIRLLVINVPLNNLETWIGGYGAPAVHDPGPASCWDEEADRPAVIGGFLHLGEHKTRESSGPVSVVLLRSRPLPLEVVHPLRMRNRRCQWTG
jgi:hypothetical protein